MATRIQHIVVTFETGDPFEPKPWGAQRRLWMPIIEGATLREWLGRVQAAYIETFGERVVFDQLVDPAFSPMEVPLDLDAPASSELSGLPRVSARASAMAAPEGPASVPGVWTCAGVQEAAGLGCSNSGSQATWNLWVETTSAWQSGQLQGLTVQGPHQALAMLQGRKLIENRSWPIPVGWYALRVGAARGSHWGRLAADKYRDMPRDEEALAGVPMCAIVGLIHIAEQRSVAECGEDFWAYGPICHIISQTVQLEAPIAYSTQQRCGNLWPLSERTWQRIAEQLPRCRFQIFQPPATFGTAHRPRQGPAIDAALSYARPEPPLAATASAHASMTAWNRWQ